MSPQPRNYSVSPSDKAPLLRFFEEALEQSGVRVVSRPSPSVAPFRYLIQHTDGRQLRLVAYLFRATKYKAGSKEERPPDEHRFQIKYGSDFSHYHHLEIRHEDSPDTVTLFLGIHLERGIMVGCDPSMHNPTWFSKSVEFKEAHVEAALATGWIAWERERIERGRRKQSLPLLDYRTEAVVAFTPKHLGRYIDLERISTGLDPGERMFLADALPDENRHQLEVELGLTANEIMDLIKSAFRLEVAVRGGAAQRHLQRILEATDGVTRVRPIDQDARPDFEVQFRGRSRLITIECKNVLRRSSAAGVPIVEYQKTRASKGDPICGRYYSVSHCDILAACLFPIRARWEYRFCPSGDLPPHPDCPGKVKSKIPVGNSSWNSEIASLLDQISGAP